VIRFLVATVYLAAALRAQTPPAHAKERATLRAIEYLTREVPRWSKENGCFSCHNNGDGARALYLAQKRGYQVPKLALADTTAWLLTPAEWDRSRATTAASDKKLARIQFAAALTQAYEAGVVADRAALRKAAESLLRDQDPDGSWHVDAGSAAGSPVTYGTALSTYIARHTLEITGFAESAARATHWLVSAMPHNTLDAAALLLAAPSRRDCAEMILHAQSSNGGWGPNALAASEPFDTAIVLLAIREPKAAARGVEFLIARQRPDGGWPETTRPPGAQSYAQHISTSAWATLALLADVKR
jgi:squalene cyclase